MSAILKPFIHFSSFYHTLDLGADFDHFRALQ